MSGFVRVASRGPAPVSSAAEIARVLELRREGMSLRAIAETVYGDRRLKNRVARLLRSTYDRAELDAAQDVDVTVLLAGILDDDAVDEL